MNVEIILYDGNKDIDLDNIKSQLPKDALVDIVLGEMPNAVKDTIDLAVISPGVPTDLPLASKILTA